MLRALDGDHRARLARVVQRARRRASQRTVGGLGFQLHAGNDDLRWLLNEIQKNVIAKLDPRTAVPLGAKRPHQADPGRPRERPERDPRRPTMNFDLTQDQKQIVETAAAFTPQGVAGLAAAREMRRDPVGYSGQIWKQMGELGWLGILVPRIASGASARIVRRRRARSSRSLGTTLVPEPYIASVVLAGRAMLLAAGEARSRRSAGSTPLDRRRRLATRSSSPTPSATSRFDPLRVATRAEKTGGGVPAERREGLRPQRARRRRASSCLARTAGTSEGAGDREGVSAFVVDAKTRGAHDAPCHDDGRASRGDPRRSTTSSIEADRRLGGDGGRGAP